MEALFSIALVANLQAARALLTHARQSSFDVLRSRTNEHPKSSSLGFDEVLAAVLAD